MVTKTERKQRINAGLWSDEDEQIWEEEKPLRKLNFIQNLESKFLIIGTIGLIGIVLLIISIVYLFGCYVDYKMIKFFISQ
jgi:hypothetical protein